MKYFSIMLAILSLIIISGCDIARTGQVAETTVDARSISNVRAGSFFNFTVKTANREHAGTDNHVYVQMEGQITEFGQIKQTLSPEFRLNNLDINDFKRGATDYFRHLDCPSDLGTIKAIWIRKTGYDDWICSSITVTHSNGGSLICNVNNTFSEWWIIPVRFSVQ